MTWEELTREVINRRLTGEDMHAIADALDTEERTCAAIYAQWSQRRRRNAEVGPPVKLSVEAMLAEWQRCRRNRWEDAVIEAAALKALLDAEPGIAYREIAKRLGASLGAVGRAVRLLKFGTRDASPINRRGTPGGWRHGTRLDAAQRRMMVAMLAAGREQDDIAAAVGCSQQTVSYWATKVKLDAKREAGGCRWPMWPHEGRPNGLYCGKPCQPEANAPYCPAHHAFAYQPGTSLREMDRARVRLVAERRKQMVFGSAA